jgi:CRISPR-associated protein Csx10
MAVLTYQIRFLEPVLVTKLDGDPNSNISHDYLPGSVLRAALLGRFASDNNVAVKDVLEDERTKADAARLFFGRARFLSAYPVDRLNNRTLPKPLSWRQSKSARNEARDDEKHNVPIYDFAIAQRDNDQYQRAEGIFCFMGDRGSTVRLVSPERQVMIHTQRASRDGKRNYGRALKGDEAVYRYESLAAGQVFAAVILCDEADAELFESLLKGEYSLGGARTAGYGRVRIENAKRIDTWREAPSQIEDAAHELIVTLTSDVLLRNPHGQYVADAELLARHIAERLGVEAPLEQAFVSAHPVGGFNRKWGLPLPQALAFEMGSVLVLKPAQPVSADRLRALEESGIGERRVDGFGRLVFNWQYCEQLSIEAPVRSEPASKSIGGDALSKEVAQRMAERILRARMEVQLMAQAGRIHIERSPGRTQLSRLRNIVLDELRQPKPTQITRGQETKSRLQWFLDDILKRQVTREAWGRARVEPNGKALVEWIKSVHDADVDDADKWRKAVGLRDKEVPKVEVGNDVSAELTATMRREFSLRLIAEVLKRAAKQQR